MSGQMLLPGEPLHRALLSPETLARLREHRPMAPNCGPVEYYREKRAFYGVTSWQDRGLPGPNRRGLPVALRERMG